MSALPHDTDRSVFEKAAPGHTFEVSDEIFGMGGLAVASDGEIDLVAFPGETGVRRVIIGENGPVAMSAVPFVDIAHDTPDNLYRLDS